MKSKTIVVILLFVFSFVNLFSQQIDSLTEKHFKELAIKESVTNTAFKTGERLKYRVRYGFINAGEAELVLKETSLDSLQVYHAVVNAKTIGMANVLYKVRDVYESYFDKNTGIPYKSVRNIHESNYKWYNEVYFNHSTDTLHSIRKNKIRRAPDNILDVLSAFYYARNNLYNAADLGGYVKFCTYFSDEFHLMRIKYVGKEKIKTKAGRFMCRKYIPIVDKGRLFDSDDDLKIWVSDDAKRLLVRVQSDLLIGSIKCDLVDYDL